MTKLQYVLGQGKMIHAKNQVTALLESKIKLPSSSLDGFNIAMCTSSADILQLSQNLRFLRNLSILYTQNH